MKQDFDTYTTWMSLDKILLKKKCLIENTLIHTHTHTHTHTLHNSVYVQGQE